MRLIVSSTSSEDEVQPKRRRKSLILTAVNQRSWSEKYAEKGQLLGERNTMYIGILLGTRSECK